MKESPEFQLRPCPNAEPLLVIVFDVLEMMTEPQPCVTLRIPYDPTHWFVVHPGEPFATRLFGVELAEAVPLATEPPVLLS